MALKIFKRGTWLYAGFHRQPVDVIGLDYDFWYDVGRADGQLDVDERPGPFSSEGLIFYVRFQRAGETHEPTWVESGGHTTIDAAMHDAESRTPTKIRWDE